MRNNKIVIRLLVAIICFAYWAIPVVQYYTFSSFSDRTNDYYVFYISSSIFQFFLMFEKAPVPILVQLTFFLITWWVINKLVVSYIDRRGW